MSRRSRGNQQVQQSGLRTKVYVAGKWKEATGRERQLLAGLECVADNECLPNCSARFETHPAARAAHLCPACLACDILDNWAAGLRDPVQP